MRDVKGEVTTIGTKARAGASGRAGALTFGSWRWSSNGAARLSLLLAGAVSLLGCPEYFYSSRAYFANTTRQTVNVRVQKLLADVDCDRLKGRSSELLARRELFGEPTTYEVGAGETLPLDYDESRWSPDDRCAAIVQLLGFPDQLVFWPADATFAQTETKRAESANKEFLAQSLTLEGHEDVRALAAGAGLEVTPLPPLSTGGEAVVDSPAALGWSGTPRTGAGWVLMRREPLPDGCLSLLLAQEPAPGWPLFLCAPDWSFPFEVGDKLAVLAQELPRKTASYQSADQTPAALHLSISRGDTVLSVWLNVSPPQMPAVEVAVVEGAPGRHTACGAYVEPASVKLSELGLVLGPRDDREAVVAGRRARAFLGRAEDVLVAPDTCGPEYASLGTRFDLLMLNTPAEVSP